MLGECLFYKDGKGPIWTDGNCVPGLIRTDGCSATGPITAYFCLLN